MPALTASSSDDVYILKIFHRLDCARFLCKGLGSLRKIYFGSANFFAMLYSGLARNYYK